MKSNRRFLGAAALLALVLNVSPLAGALRDRGDDPGFSFRERIVRFIEDIRKVFTVGTNDNWTIPKP